MKRIYFFIAALTAVGAVTSCSSSDTEENPTTKAIPAVVNLNLNAGKIMSRATVASGDEATINGGYAAAFDVNNAIVGTSQSFTTSRSFNTTTQATQISVAVNQGAGVTFASTVNTKSLFESITTDLASTATSTTSANSQDAKKLPMYGNTALTFTDAVASPTVDLYHLVAKVVMSSITTSFAGTGYDGATFVPKEVFMYNANTICTFGGVGSSPASGENTDGTTLAEKITPTAFKYLSTGLISTLPTPYNFYVFPHLKDAAPTKIVIKGVFTPSGGSPVTVYYPIVINKFQDGTTITKDGTALNATSNTDDSKIVKNTCYTVSITIKGKGMANPDTDIVPATANVTFNVVNWTDYTQDVTVQ